MGIIRIVAGALFGLVLGAVGAMVHRAVFPLGLILMLALALAVGTLSLSLAGRGGLFACFLGWVGGAALLSNTGPTGDVLVPQTAVGSWVWMLGTFAILILVLALPKRWFSTAARPVDGQTAEMSEPVASMETKSQTKE